MAIIGKVTGNEVSVELGIEGAAVVMKEDRGCQVPSVANVLGMVVGTVADADGGVALQLFVDVGDRVLEGFDDSGVAAKNR